MVFSLREPNLFLNSFILNPKYCAWSDSLVNNDDEFEPADEEIAAVEEGTGTGTGKGKKVGSLGIEDRGRLPRTICNIIVRGSLCWCCWFTRGGCFWSRNSHFAKNHSSGPWYYSLNNDIFPVPNVRSTCAAWRVRVLHGPCDLHLHSILCGPYIARVTTRPLFYPTTLLRYIISSFVFFHLCFSLVAAFHCYFWLFSISFLVILAPPKLQVRSGQLPCGRCEKIITTDNLTSSINVK